MSRKAPIRKLNCDPNLIPVKNGIYDYKNQRLLSFSPDYVFSSKCAVEYNHLAQNIFIKNADGTMWDVESWMNELSDDPDIVELLWQVIAASIRSHVKWNKAVFLYSRVGNNGKGTLCQLIRNIVGESACISMSMEDFEQRFLPHKLLQASVIIGDENPVGTNLDKSKVFKSAVTHDVVRADIKYEHAKDFRFKGFIIQCINEILRTRDRTGSFARRLLIIPFEKTFTGKENKDIKDSYLKRKDVLEYILYRAISMRFKELSEPDVCVEALGYQRESNDPIRQFWGELREVFVWNLLPRDFLYDLFKNWMARNIPGVTPTGRNNFMVELREIIEKDPEWVATEGQVRVTNLMISTPEPLIAEYNLDRWKNPVYTGHDISKICRPFFKEKYTGLMRR